MLSIIALQSVKISRIRLLYLAATIHSLLKKNIFFPDFIVGIFVHNKTMGRTYDKMHGAQIMNLSLSHKLQNLNNAPRLFLLFVISFAHAFNMHTAFRS